jgi:hypothetical protein
MRDSILGNLRIKDTLMFERVLMETEGTIWADMWRDKRRDDKLAVRHQVTLHTAILLSN